MVETVGMILCGGFGKRLRPVTEKIPKPLVEIKEDYTILDKQLFDFKNAGVEEVYLLCGFLHEKIQERFGDVFKGVKINYVIEDEPLGTLNAIRLGFEAIGNGKQAVIRNGDVVADLNISKMIESGENSDYPFLIFITQMQSPYGIVETSGDRLTSFKEKPLLDYYI
ncbi:MAG: nucleotidyltransferase family protein, partial [Methanobrevibacter sp.]|nr:nucleotidyltransferase family protein [Methanobrevibacter sp.]